MKRLPVLVLISFLGIAHLGFALDYKPIYPSFTPIRESKAYQKFATRPLTDFSKLLYLIDRFGDADISINYDGQTYTAKFAITVARWFLARNYKKQTPQQWINQWCTKSIGNKTIFVKLPNGKFRPSREILMDELKALEEIVRENNQKPQLVAEAAIPTAPEIKAAEPEIKVPTSGIKVPAAEIKPEPVAVKHAFESVAIAAETQS